MLLIGVETIGWLVQDQDFRIMQNGLRETNTAFVAFGKRINALVHHAGKACALTNGVDLAFSVGTIEAAYFGNEFQKGACSHVAVGRCTLR